VFTVTKVGKWMDWGGITLMLKGGSIGQVAAGVEFNNKFQPDLESIDGLMERKPQNMYLTHFGRVTDVPRLAADLRKGIEQFADWGEAFAAHEQRHERIAEAMMAWLMERARAHGVTASDGALREIFAGDVELNTQGIEFWLDRRG